MSGYIMIFSTIGSKREARKLAKELVKKKLVACVNIIPKIKSVYEWDGSIHDEKESLMMMKTRAELFEEVKKFITKRHSYEVPEVISIDIKEGHLDYLDWISNVTAPLNAI